MYFYRTPIGGEKNNLFSLLSRLLIMERIGRKFILKPIKSVKKKKY